ncbi:MAG: hypothetical protein IH861_06085 [Chloroflexi bacterium]|nr:hypothetical protein [Chloroflexota bacterium]
MVIPPEAQTHFKVVNELIDNKKSDYAVTIISVAYLEELLKEAIAKHFVEGAKIREIFRSNSALGTFEARINLSHALDLIGDHSRDDLKLVAKIRNRFAHVPFGVDLRANPSAFPITFKSQSVRDLCKNFWGLQNINPMTEIPNSEEISEPRMFYLTSVNLLFSAVWNAGFRARHFRDLCSGGAPIQPKW